MAKSLKSKSKRQFRKVKREDPKSTFYIAEQLRLSRLSTKLKASTLAPKALTDAEEYRRAQEGYETEEEVEPKEAVVDEAAAAKDMEVDGAEPKKVSTSGPRLARREAYRTDKGFQVRLARKTEFAARGEGKRMGCKPHRRR